MKWCESPAAAAQSRSEVAEAHWSQGMRTALCADTQCKAQGSCWPRNSLHLHTQLMETNSNVLAVAPTLYIKLHVDSVLNSRWKMAESFTGGTEMSSSVALLRAKQSTSVHNSFLMVWQIREITLFWAETLPCGEYGPRAEPITPQTMCS